MVYQASVVAEKSVLSGLPGQCGSREELTVWNLASVVAEKSVLTGLPGQCGSREERARNCTY